LSESRKVVGDVWCELLGVESAHPTDNFFESGGTSLLAGRLIARVRRRLGHSASLSELLLNPTLEGFIESVDATASAGRGPVPVHHPGPGPHPLTVAQTARISRYRRDPAAPRSGTHIMSLGFDLSGEVDISKLAAAVERAGARHDAVSMTFTISDDPQQTVGDGKMQLTVLPMTAESEAHEVGWKAATEPFDLETGPLARAVVVPTGPDKHAFFVSLEHLVGDAWSMSVLLTDIADEYLRLRRGEPPRADRPMSLQDVAYFEREWLNSAQATAAQQYWHTALADTGSYAPLNLPGTVIPTGAARHGATVHTHEPDAEMLAIIRTAAAHAQITPYMLIVAALAKTAQTFGAGDDIAIVSPTANRDHVDLENVVGWASNLITLRLSLSASDDVRTLLHKVRTVCTDAQRHGRYPIQRLDKELSPDLWGKPQAIPQLYLDVTEEPIEFRLDGVTARDIQPPIESVIIGVGLWGRLGGDGAAFDLAHLTAYLDPARGREFLEAFRVTALSIASELG
jgi:hypothetical protein